MPSGQPRPEIRSLINYLDTLLTQYCQVASKPLLLLALSGGVDSVVLLHLLKILQQTRDFDLHVMHVHHGLSEHADDWAAFCQTLCNADGIPCVVKHVDIDSNDALGIEAAARQARYDALFSYEVGGVKPDMILTAHHQQDQAETVLLQLMRGAGVKGLSAMPVFDAKKRLLRPLLNSTKIELLQIAEVTSLPWCEDDSNTNTDFDRNFLRHDVLPLIESRYPSAQASLARCAGHFASAQVLLDDLAEIDAEALVEKNSICLKGLSNLSVARANNLLRWWFGQNQLQMPSSEQLAEVLHQLLTAKADAAVALAFQAVCIRRYQSRAYLTSNNKAVSFELQWRGEQSLPLPNGDCLLFSRAKGQGLALPKDMPELKIVSRSGGERFKPEANRPSKTLKHLLQEKAIPPWEREYLPLVYSGDDLIYVPFVGEASDYQVQPDQQGLLITYQPLSIE